VHPDDNLAAAVERQVTTLMVCTCLQPVLLHLMYQGPSIHRHTYHVSSANLVCLICLVAVGLQPVCWGVHGNLHTTKSTDFVYSICGQPEQRIEFWCFCSTTGCQLPRLHDMRPIRPCSSADS
jgi:hypothetical protein